MAALLVVLLVGGAAYASWLATGGGAGYSKARTMPAGSQPTASASGRNVTVTWSQSSFAGDGPVAGYTVRRYSSPGGVLQAIGSACSGTIAAVTCIERGLPVGTWQYSVTPKQGNNWTGAESAKSAAVTVGSPALTITSPTTVNVLPTTLNGNIANFIDGESLSFHLDSAAGTTLAGTVGGTATPTAVPTGGAAAVTVTIPSGTSSGAHTIFAVASTSGETASAGFTIALAPTPTSLAIANGGTSARPDKGDTMTVVFSQAMSVSSMCSTWTTGDAGNQSVTGNNVVTVTIQNNAAPGTSNDLLSVSTASPACGGTSHFGTVDLGSQGFVTADATFLGSGSGGNMSTVGWTAATRTLVISLGANGVGSGVTNAGSFTAKYTPDPAMTNTSGTGVIGTVNSANTTQF